MRTLFALIFLLMTMMARSASPSFQQVTNIVNALAGVPSFSTCIVTNNKFSWPPDNTLTNFNNLVWAYRASGGNLTNSTSGIVTNLAAGYYFVDLHLYHALKADGGPAIIPRYWLATNGVDCRVIGGTVINYSGEVEYMGGRAALSLPANCYLQVLSSNTFFDSATSGPVALRIELNVNNAR
jgi:hypothetical protein